MVVDGRSLAGFPAQHEELELRRAADEVASVVIVAEAHVGADERVVQVETSGQLVELGQRHCLGARAVGLDDEALE